jgi:hypothetical protein
MTRTRKLNPFTLCFFALAFAVIFFACAFSVQGFFTIGADLTGYIETWPVLGWIIKLAQQIPHATVFGCVLIFYAGLKFWQAKGVTFFEGVLFVLGLLAIGGAETLANNIGYIAGFCLFLWVNAVQLSVWAGQMAGFSPSWGKNLKPWIVVAYVLEFAVNLFRFPPYGDGNPATLFNDLRWGLVDPALVDWWAFVWMVVSIGAIEFTFVFFLRYLGTVREEMVKRSGQRVEQTRTARTQRTANTRGARVL